MEHGTETIFPVSDMGVLSPQAGGEDKKLLPILAAAAAATLAIPAANAAAAPAVPAIAGKADIQHHRPNQHDN